MDLRVVLLCALFETLLAQGKLTSIFQQKRKIGGKKSFLRLLDNIRPLNLHKNVIFCAPLPKYLKFHWQSRGGDEFVTALWGMSADTQSPFL